METKLARIAHVAREHPKEQFTSLVHIINVDMLLECHYELDGNKASGIDKVSKDKYEENLLGNIKKLHESLVRMAYRPQPGCVFKALS